MTWTLRQVDDDVVGRLEAALGVRRITARCLAARGIEAADDARMYLAPRLGQLRPPAGLAGLTDAVARLADAVQAGERIGVFGDYDVDGVTTAALIASFLRELDAACLPRVAHRDAGYGFGDRDADHFASAGCRVIVTVDCGTSDEEAIARAKSRGVDVIVVDHHTVPAHTQGPGGDQQIAHPALALVNPLRADSTFPFRSMASVGLGFYLTAALRTELDRRGFFRSRHKPDPRSLLDLVALGTVADLVPLKHENRILTSIGLRCLARSQRPGIAALMTLAEVTPERPIDERTIGWRLGPRLNAPGRMGDAEPALQLLLATSEAEAAPWAARIEEANAARREAQKVVLEQALEALAGAPSQAAVIVAGQGWSSGVTGIVANKLMELYRRPAFVLSIDERTKLARGSGRAPAGYHLYDILERCAERLVRFGGHAGAAGLTVAAAEIEALEGELQAAVVAQEADGRGAGAAGVGDHIDAEVALGDVDAELCQQLDRLGPFGQGNEKPLLGCRGMLVRESRRVGDGSHLKLEVEDRHGVARSAIAFGQGEQAVEAGATIAAAFAPMISVWRGESRVELDIRAIHAGR